MWDLAGSCKRHREGTFSLPGAETLGKGAALLRGSEWSLPSLSPTLGGSWEQGFSVQQFFVTLLDTHPHFVLIVLSAVSPLGEGRLGVEGEAARVLSSGLWESVLCWGSESLT